MENYEDWYGMGLMPNTTYKYKFGIYNYLNIEYKKDEEQAFSEIEKKIHTLPLNVNLIIILEIIMRRRINLNLNVNMPTKEIYID